MSFITPDFLHFILLHRFIFINRCAFNEIYGNHFDKIYLNTKSNLSCTNYSQIIGNMKIKL